VDEVLHIIGLAERQKDRVDKFSGGMKRRVNIGVALLHKPAVVIMDEPTVGIDPQSRRHILDNVKELNREGMTVLYTTHYMEEAAELSHHIAIMIGQIIAWHAELSSWCRANAHYLTLNTEAGRCPAWRTVGSIDSTDGK
jgi:ABC-2 type transport system ATP-binding protein